MPSKEQSIFIAAWPGDEVERGEVPMNNGRTTLEMNSGMADKGSIMMAFRTSADGCGIKVPEPLSILI